MKPHYDLLGGVGVSLQTHACQSQVISHDVLYGLGVPSSSFLFLDGGSTVDVSGADDDMSNSTVPVITLITISQTRCHTRWKLPDQIPLFSTMWHF